MDPAAASQYLKRNPELLKSAHGWKDQKEAFVSGLVGGALTEINLVTAVGPASILLWSALQSRLGMFEDHTVLVAVIDGLLICGSLLYSTTALADNILLLLALLLAPAVLLLATESPQPPRVDKTRKPAKKDESRDLDPLPIKPFITSYRGWMMLITCSCILAVDFHVFPRRFAKVETWGTSLMDLGVGSFVFSNGVVAAKPVLKKAGVQGLGTRLVSALRHALPIAVLGVIRLISVKGIDYAEHVSEYGVHWNFFFTLAAIPPFVAIFDTLFSLLPAYGLFSIVVAVVYQIALDTFNLVDYVTTAPRIDFFSRNREGILSLAGYLAIFLAGQGAGTFCLPRYERVRNPLKHPLFLKLAQWSAIWCALFFLATDYRWGAGVSVSRRLANLPYVLWVAAFNTVQLSLLCAMELYIFPNIYTGPDDRTERRKGNEACSRVFRAFNRNGLAIFLVANLLTGLVNMTLPTLRMGNLEAMAVLIAYMGVLTALAFALDAYNISIKL